MSHQVSMPSIRTRYGHDNNLVSLGSIEPDPDFLWCPNQGMERNHIMESSHFNPLNYQDYQK
jgi:hypothetical protein